MRLLTSAEIEKVVSVFDDLYLGLDPFTRKNVVNKIKQKITAELKVLEMDPDLIYKLRSELARIYKPVEAGKAVGIITAQSVGEMQTQMNLNVFHRAGYRDHQTENSSRLQELTCTSKSETQHFVSLSIYFRKGILSREEMLKSLVYKTLSSYTEEYRKCTFVSKWETVYCKFFNFNPPAKDKYRLKLNLEYLYRYRITLDEIARSLSVCEVVAIYSPLHIGEICIFADAENLKKCFGNILHGIPGITLAYFLPRSISSDELFIETEGSNFEQVLYLPFVDSFNTMTNDMWEIYSLFGIEAVRQFLVEELQTIMNGVHFGHIEFLADRMTVSGHLRSMTRYTRKTESRASALSKITFEETVRRASEAAFKEFVDNVKGCSASVIVGKPPSTGSGMNEIYFEFE